MPQLLEANGIACLSGLQDQDFEEILSILTQINFHVQSKSGREEWLAFAVSR
jgi:ribosomal protein L11 methylase PrmA